MRQSSLGKLSRERGVLARSISERTSKTVNRRIDTGSPQHHFERHSRKRLARLHSGKNELRSAQGRHGLKHFHGGVGQWNAMLSGRFHPVRRNNSYSSIKSQRGF